MSSTFLALMLMQYVVSVKAGLVNHVQGTANVAEMEMARPGRPISTAANGYVEVLLTPGSFLRIGENSAVVLDGVDLESVSLHLVQGPAVIEVIDINKNHPIRVTTGKLTTDIVAAGIYKFSGRRGDSARRQASNAFQAFICKGLGGFLPGQLQSEKGRQGSDHEPRCLQPGSIPDDIRCQLQPGFTNRRFLLWDRSVLAVRSPHRLFHLYPSQQLPLSLRLPLLRKRRRPCRELQGQFIFEWVVRRWDESGPVIQSGE